MRNVDRLPVLSSKTSQKWIDYQYYYIAMFFDKEEELNMARLLQLHH
jgi:hypothetical protein